MAEFVSMSDFRQLQDDLQELKAKVEDQDKSIAAQTKQYWSIVTQSEKDKFTVMNMEDKVA